MGAAVTGSSSSSFHSSGRAIALGVAAAVLLGLACGEATASPRRIQARFLCGGDKYIDATFINSGAGSVQLAFSDGRKMTLPRAVSADGGRYANKSGSLVFWNKGRTAFVQENGKTTWEDCATAKS